MQVFLTGATGYIGSAVAEALVKAGYAVAGLARSDDQARLLAAKGLGAHRGDLRIRRVWPRARATPMP